MLRQSILFLSDSPTAKKIVTGAPISRHLAQRFVAGETLDDAIRAARNCNHLGLTASLDFLGESVSSREEALEATEMAIRSVEAIVDNRVDGNISIKPTQLGLDIDEQFCRENVERLLARAAQLGASEGEIFVRLDMESSEYVARTVALTESLRAAGFKNVGTVLQSYMRRSPDDIRRLSEIGTRVRLVKGAYKEPASVAFQDKADVDAQFVREMKQLLENGTYPAIATHDEKMIEATRHWAFERGIAKDAFEFQMLYGVRRDLQQRLREEGYNVRVYIPYGNSWYPYLMRRMAERPANLFFIANSVIKESPVSRFLKPAAIASGALAGALAALVWRGRGNGR
ncbi:proline dehydrogenase [soil metagenome]